MVIKASLTEISLPSPAFDYYQQVIRKRPFPFTLSTSLSWQRPSYTFMGADPFMLIASKGERIEIIKDGGRRIIKGKNPIELLERLLYECKVLPLEEGIPLACGAVGYLAYDLCRFVEKIDLRSMEDLGFPELYFGFYDRIICLDHLREKTYIIDIRENFPRKRAVRGKKEEFFAILDDTSFSTYTHYEVPGLPLLKSNFCFDGYLKAIERAKEYIRAGDIYQVNLSQRLSTRLRINPCKVFSNFLLKTPSPYLSIFEFGERAIMSSSPELFLYLQGGNILTRPIKGTRPRGISPQEDEDKKAELLESKKDEAELVMIVDLERNDLGRICEYGSVKVEALKILEEHPTVFHLSSTIHGRLCSGVGLLELLRATFPGGSVTGAPKIRAIQIIDELEPTRRGPYTGGIGFISFDGTICLSMAIRILLMHKDLFNFQVGGAIVIDSIPQQEYEETLVKAKGIIKSILE